MLHNIKMCILKHRLVLIILPHRKNKISQAFIERLVLKFIPAAPMYTTNIQQTQITYYKLQGTWFKYSTWPDCNNCFDKYVYNKRIMIHLYKYNYKDLHYNKKKKENVEIYQTPINITETILQHIYTIDLQKLQSKMYASIYVNKTQYDQTYCWLSSL